MVPTDLQTEAEGYVKLLEAVVSSADLTAAEGAEPAAPLSELEIQSLWSTGIFGRDGLTVRHGPVRILDFGEWNRSAGPDFLRAEIESAGRIVRGDIEIDPHAQDWERHGHGANPMFNNVVLHVVLCPPPKDWYTRNSLHLEVPVFYLDAERVRKALCLRRQPVCSPGAVSRPCGFPLRDMNSAEVKSLLRAVAAYRLSCKRKQFYRRVDVAGGQQAWFEALAETLGYSANRENMLLLARRVPLRVITQDPEPILLGMAGFLSPILPARSSAEAREYHRRVWDAWWKLKSTYGLSAERTPKWNLSGLRPLNHPQRRVAALAACAAVWPRIQPLLNAAGASALTDLLTQLRHPFWDRHCTIDAQPFKGRSALIGRQRVDAFLANYVYAADESAEAWQAYTGLPASTLSARAQRTAYYLFGEREELQHLLRFEYVQQAILQISGDFCSENTCGDCLFPQQLRAWKA